MSTGNFGSYYARRAGELPWLTAVDFIIWFEGLFGFSRWVKTPVLISGLRSPKFTSYCIAMLFVPPIAKSLSSAEVNILSFPQAAAAAWFKLSFILRFFTSPSLSEWRSNAVEKLIRFELSLLSKIYRPYNRRLTEDSLPEKSYWEVSESIEIFRFSCPFGLTFALICSWNCINRPLEEDLFTAAAAVFEVDTPTP